MNKMIRSCWSWLVAATLALVCMDARAEAKDIVIHADGSVTYGGESAETYSSGNYYAITKAGDFGDSVSSIKTEGEVANAGTSITYTGVRGIDAASAPLSLTSMPGGIDIANNGWIGAINQQASGATETSDVRLEGIGDIKVKSSGSYGAKGFGFNSAKNPDITQSKFYAAANSLTVEAEGTAYAIHGALAGRTARIDIAGAVTVKGVGASGKAYGSNLTAATPMGQSEWNFGSLTVSSESQLAYGLHCAGGVTAQVALNGDMIVTGATYAIGFRLAGTADFTLKGKDAKPIDVKVMSGSKYAMAADIGGSSSTAKLDLTADNFIVMSSTEAYGPYVENAGAGFFGDVRNLSVNGGTGTACALYVNGGTASLVGCTNLLARGATSSTAIQAENGATVSLGEAELPTALAGDVTLEAGATLNLSNAVDLAGNVSNAGTVSIGYKAGRPAIALTGAFENTGTLAVDMTGADADVEYTLIDNLDGSENVYGTISITPGWSTKVVDGDLVAYVKWTAQIGAKKYQTLAAAMADARAATTQEGKTIVVCGQVDGFNFNGDNTGITLVGVEGNEITGDFYADGNVSLKNVTFRNLKFVGGKIWFSTNVTDYENLTIEGCTFDGTGAGTTNPSAITINRNGTVNADGIKIKNNMISNYYPGGSASGILIGNSATKAHGVEVVGNTIENVGFNAVQLQGCDGLTLTGNTVSDALSWAAFNLANSTNIRIDGNVVKLIKSSKYPSYPSQALIGNANGFIVMGPDNQITTVAGETLTDLVAIVQNDGAAIGDPYYNDQVVFVADAVTVYDAQGKIVDGPIVASVANVNSRVAEGLDVDFLSDATLTGLVYCKDVADKVVELAAGAVTGTIVVPADRTFTIKGDVTFTAGAKIYIPLVQDSEEFVAWKTANVPAGQESNVTVCGYIAQVTVDDATTKYYALDEAVAAVGEAEAVIVVFGDPSKLTAPDDWKFKTEGDVTTLVRKEYVAEIVCDGESYGKYETLEDAVGDLMKGDTLKLLATVDDGIVLPYMVTLDKNGFACGAVTAAEGYAVVTFGNGLQRTYMDSWERPDLQDLTPYFSEDMVYAEFHIATPAQFAGFAAIVNGTAVDMATGELIDTSAVQYADGSPIMFYGYKVILDADIDLRAHSVVPVGLDVYSSNFWDYTDRYFSGWFNGNGHKVTYAQSEDDAIYDYNALFGMLYYAYVHDLTIDVTASYPTGSMINKFGNDVYGAPAGLAAYTQNADVENVTLNGSFLLGSYGTQGSGLVAIAGKNTSFRSCTNNTTVNVKQYYRDGASTSSAYFIVGGIAGQTSCAANTTAPSVTFIGCVNNSNVISQNPYDNDRVNGVETGYGSFAYLAANGSTVACSRKLNAGAMVGQISGGKEYQVLIQDCVDNGSVIGTHMEKINISDRSYNSRVQNGGFIGKQYVGGSSEPVDCTIVLNDPTPMSAQFYANDNIYIIDADCTDYSVYTKSGEGRYYRNSWNSPMVISQTVNGKATVVSDQKTIDKLIAVKKLAGPVVYDSVVIYQLPPVCKIGSATFGTLASAVAAAEGGDVIDIIADISDETVTVEKNVTITSDLAEKPLLTNVKLTTIGADVALTVSKLAFAGNSYINASSTRGSLTVDQVTANVEPAKLTGRSAFIVLSPSELQTPIDLTITDCSIQGYGAADSYGAAVFGWRWLDKVTITGNTFGSPEKPYRFIAVKLMNAENGAAFDLTGNTVYGTNASYGFYAFDLYQNCSRDNVYTATVSNTVINVNEAESANDFCALDVEANVLSGVYGHGYVYDTGSTVNGKPITWREVLLDMAGDKPQNGGLVVIRAVTDENGKLVGGWANREPTAAERSQYFPYGFTAKLNADGIFEIVELPRVAEVLDADGTVQASYCSLSEAFAAVQDGGTVKILAADGAEAAVAVAAEGKTFALDLNGQTLATALTVEAGSMTLTNGAVSTTVTVAGGTLAVVAGAKVVAPVAVSVAGGALDVSGGQLQGLTTNAVQLGRGASATVAGGTFIAPAGVSPIAADEASAATGDYPANFIWPQLDDQGDETGYPLFSSTLPPAYVADGYVIKDNKNGTWTVTAGAREVQVEVPADVTPAVTVDPTSEAEVTEAEKTAAAAEVKESLVQTLTDPVVTDIVGTGVQAATFEKQGETIVLQAPVVAALKEEAVSNLYEKAYNDAIAVGKTPEEAKAEADGQLPTIQNDVNEAIKPESAATSTSHVEVKLDGMAVSVSASVPEAGSPKVIEKTLTTVVYDVKPIVTTTTVIGEEVTTVRTVLPADTVLENPITFRLWLDEAFRSEGAEVKHKIRLEDDPIDTKQYIVRTEDGKRYVDLTWNRFSFAEVLGATFEGKACLANGTAYDSVTEALAASLPEDATIELLADCGETGLALGAGRTIQLNGHLFSGSLATADGNEMVKTTDGEIYEAPIAVDVPTSETTHMSVRGFAFPPEVTTDEAKRAYLAAEVNGRPRWQGYALGTDVKLLPVIVGAAEGFSTVVIRAQDGFAVNTPARCGVSVKFNLVWKAAGSGAFMQYGETLDEPHFQVDVKDIGPNTRWKIQTMFETTEAE